MEIQTAYKVDRHRSDSWSGIYGYTPEDKTELSQYGEIYAVLSLSAAIDFDLNNIAALLLDELQRSYFNGGEQDVEIEHFEMALNMLRKHLEEILSREEALAQTGVDLEAAVVVFKEQVMYAAVIGESKIFVGRGEEVNEISGVLIDPELNGFMRTGSMLLEDDDRVLLATDAIASGNSETKIIDSLEKFDLVNIKENRGAVLMLGHNLTTAPMADTAMAAAQEETSSKHSVTQNSPATHTPDYLDNDKKPEPTAPVNSRISMSGTSRGSEMAAKGKEMLSQGLVSGKKVIANVANKIQTQFGEDGFDFGKFAKSVQGKSQRAFQSSVSTIRGLVQKEPGASRLPNSRAAGRGIANSNSPIRIPFGGIKMNRNQAIALAGVALLAIIVGTFINLNIQNQRREALEALQTRINTVLSDFEGQQAVADLAESVNDRENVVSAMDDIESRISELETEELLTEQMNTQLQAVRGQIDDAVNSALGIEAFTQPRIIADLAADFEGANPSDIAYANGRIYVVDRDRGAVYRMGVTPDSVPEEIVTGLNKPYLITTDNDSDLVIVDKASSGAVIKLDTDTNQVTRQAGLSSDVIGNLIDIDVWTNGALYAVSDKRTAIVRMDRVGADYAIPNYTTPWRKDNQFANALDIKVDFSIYVLLEGAGLKRYFGGEPAPLNLSGLLPSDQTALNSADAMETTDRRVFLADSDGQRLFSFTKNLNDDKQLSYEGQYQFQGDGDILSNIKEVILNDNNTQIYLLDGSKVIRIDRATF